MRSVQQLLLEFREHLKSSGLQPASIDSYCRDAKGFLNFLAESGSGFSHFEAAVGATLQDYHQTLPAFSLAYRGQRPGNALMFRAGIGVPEFIFVGLGFSF